jgi:hypothetical protein
MDQLHLPMYKSITQPFRYPADEFVDGAPWHKATFAKPIALSDIQAKLSKGQYVTADQFEGDFKMMFANCVQYNNEGTKAYEDGKNLEYCFQEHWKKREAWIAQLTSNSVTTALAVRPKQASQRETREARGECKQWQIGGFLPE